MHYDANFALEAKDVLAAIDRSDLENVCLCAAHGRDYGIVSAPRKMLKLEASKAKKLKALMYFKRSRNVVTVSYALEEIRVAA